MKKSLLLLLFVVVSASSINAQSFIDRLPTVTTKLKGCTTSGAELKVYGHDDMDHFIKSGVSFELLNMSTIKDRSKVNTIKVKITYDYNNASNVGLIGYLPISSTSLNQFYNSSTSKIVYDYKNLIPTATTGWKGEVTFEGLTLRMYSFDDITPALSKGTKIELLSSKMVRTHDCISLCVAKIKVLEGPEAGKIGYVYPALTTFDTKMDYTNLLITGPPAAATTTTPAYTGGYNDLPNYTTERTGITGTVTISYGAMAYEDGSDWLDDVTIPENATFVLLNKKVFYDSLTGEYFIKTKITYDPKGTYTGKTMYITILDTSLSGRFSQTGGESTVN